MRLRRSWLLLALFGGALLCPPLLAHELGRGPRPQDVALSFSFEPWVLLPLVVIGLAYARGRWRAARRGAALGRGRDLLFAGGLLALFVALVSPLDALAEALFVAHMGQHLLLGLVAPPLLLAARPLGPVLLGLPRPLSRCAGAVLQAGAGRWTRALSRQPLVVLLLHGAVLWAWHAPLAYDAALASELVHALEHLCFVVGGLLFWSVLSAAHTAGGVGHGGAVLFLFGGSLQGGVLGALLTVAARPLYASHLQSAPAFGLTPLEDQQLAGLLMWVPSGIVFAAVALAHASALLTIAERSEPAASLTGGGGS